MTHPSDSSKSEPVPASERERILREVLEDQRARKEARERRSHTPRGGDTSFFVQVGLLVSGTLFFYLLFFSPAWLAPDAAPPISAERSENSVRFSLAMVARQIDAYYAAEGRLPESLDGLAGVPEGMVYAPRGGREYRIAYATGGVEIAYESSEDLEQFARNAAAQVLGTGGASSRDDT